MTSMQLFTIGHSNHSPQDFIKLLNKHRVEVVADVRSWPHSRHAPWADAERLRDLLLANGVRYTALGEQLGGRPRAENLYDATGHVLYGRVAGTEKFRQGIERLKGGLARWRVAVMCSEENPEACHRRLLIAKVLLEHGVRVWHIRRNGCLQHEGGVGPPDGTLFTTEDDWWRSTQSALRKRPHATSLAV
jgi:uncharacterized protein (DUF488 family)